MAQRVSGVKASVGFASETGPRKRNEDFAGAVFGPELPEPRRDVIAAIADGIGGAKGGRVAAETAVRGFLDGFCDLPETMEVRRAAPGSSTRSTAGSIPKVSAGPRAWREWDAPSRRWCCAAASLIVLHVGDTRAYRLSRDRLTCLTTDHVRQDGTGRSSILTRALGVEAEVRLDYSSPADGTARPLPACAATACTVS